MPGLRNDIIYRRFDGNTKVLYCAHTDDLEKYLDRITYMLVETAMDISIFYTLNTSLITPDILDTVDLVVVPVTHNFLAENCTARTDIFIPAAQKGIRVLPILMEEGLEHEFNELCSNIQLLNITETDSTAINKNKRLADATRAYSGQSFGFDTDRMTEYRSEALSGFSKHIFLSYRRVDRIHANKIIEMIHELEFMRTVGVWYDEYLTLGNDYDEEINEKLLNSDLVIIISTPNLTRENNYVRDIEYPGAVSNNKRIIVIEAEKSDRNSLLNALPGITEIFDLNDRENIESLLKSIFGETGADGLSADTLFHIGQSYLLGLETEYNKEYAVDFLEKAFDAGSEEAGNNLITLYLSGPNTSVYYSDYFGVEDLIKNIDYVNAADLIEKQIALICENKEMKREDYLKLIKYNDLLVYCWSGAYHYPQPTDVTCKMKSLELIVGMHNRFPAQEDDIIYANCKKELLQIMSRLPGNNKNAVWQYAREVWDFYRMQSAMRGYDPACDLMRLGYDLAKATDDPIWLDKAVEYEDQYYAYLKSTRDPDLPVDIYARIFKYRRQPVYRRTRY